MTKIKEYFGKLNTAELPDNAAEFIKTQILSDADIDLLDEDDEDFLEVKNLIESDYPKAIEIAASVKEKPTKAILEGRLKLLEKMLAKAPTTVIKGRLM